MTAVLGLDLGGTRVKAALVDPTGVVLERAVAPSRERDGLEGWAHAGMTLVRQVARRSGRRPAALGLSVPGAVDPTRAVLCDLVARLPEASGLDLAATFALDRLPVAVDNDARAALAAERRWGRVRGIDDVVLLTIGTGLGSAALIGGQAPGGDRVLAGNQLGHLTVDLDGPECVCGNRGCAELYASAAGLLRLAAEAGLDGPDARAVLDAEREGDPRARRAVARFVDALAASTVNAIHAYQPGVVVLAGGVVQALNRILPALRRRVAERAWTLPRGRVAVDVSALGDDIGVLGAAAVAFEAVVDGDDP